MKVVMVETGGLGAIAHYTWNLCTALSETGTDVCLLTNVRYELENLPRKFRIDPCFDKAVGYLQAISTLMRRLSKHAPDIVHVQSLISTRFDSFLWPRVRRRIPVIFTALRKDRIWYPEAHLVIAGPLLAGTEEEYWRAIKKGGVEDAVTFRPHYIECGKVAAYFAASDVAVYNYRDITDSGALRIACV